MSSLFCFDAYQERLNLLINGIKNNTFVSVEKSRPL